MATLNRWLRLAPGERRLFLASWSLLLGIQLGLQLLPFRVLWRWLARSGQPQPGRVNRVQVPSAPRTARAVEVASRYVPGRPACLPKALAAFTLLNRYGHGSQLRIGVMRNPVGELQAHAWVEHDGHVVIGAADDLATYVVLPALEQGNLNPGALHLVRQIVSKVPSNGA